MPVIVGDDERGRPIVQTPDQINKTMSNYGVGTGAPWTAESLQDSAAAYFGANPSAGYLSPDEPSGSSGGGGGGGGSGAPSASLRNLFQWYYGSVPGIIGTADAQNWTEQDVITWSIDNGGTGTGLKVLRDTIRKTAAPYYSDGPSSIPASMVDSLIKEGYWTSDGQNYLQSTYFPELRGVGATNPVAQGYVALWTDMTGKPMGSTALQKLNEIVRTYGYTDVGMAAWEGWLKTTHSAYTGNWGAAKRYDIQTEINNILGRGATEQELSLKGSYWNLEKPALLEQLRNSDEYKEIYAGKPAWMTETEFISEAQAYDEVMRWYYGGNVVANEDGSLTIPQGPYYQEPSTKTNPTPPTANPDKAAEWKSLTWSTFETELAKVGIKATGSGKTGTYTMADGTTIAFDELIDHLPQGQFTYDDLGYHYVQSPGAKNPKTGEVTPGLIETPATVEQAYSGGFSNFGMSYVTPTLVSYLLDNNVSAQTLQQQFVWQEEAIYRKAVNQSMVQETGIGGNVDWYTLVSGAKGSGAMRAELMQAENAYAFKEAFHSYTGRNPSAEDYSYMTNNFVSPNEYARTMAAYESAEAKLPEINELMERVYGRSVSVEDVQDMVLGKEGSGSMQALLSQATRLDAFTWAFKQDQGRNPTPEEYASFAGFTGPEELTWKITTRERIAENAPVIQQLWRDVYKRELSASELQTLFGEQEGYGTLRAQWNAAEQIKKEREETEEAEWTGSRAITPFGASAEGGIELSVKPIKDL